MPRYSACLFISLLILSCCNTPDTEKLSIDQQNKIALKKEKKKGKVGIGALSRPEQSIEEWKERYASIETGEVPSHLRSKEIAFWNQMPYSTVSLAFQRIGNLPVGGRTRGLAIDVLNPLRWIAAGASGGIWISEDEGSTWIRATLPEQNAGFTCITQDTRAGREHIWYAGSGELYGNSASARNAYYYGTGMLKSTDHGETWSLLENTYFDVDEFAGSWSGMYEILIDPTSIGEGRLFAFNYGSVFLSEDGGETWSEFLDGGQAYNTSGAFTSTGTLYAAISSDAPASAEGIWRIDSSSSTPTAITPIDFPNVHERCIVKVNPHNENQVYFLLHTPGSGKLTNVFFDGEEYNSLWRYTRSISDTSSIGGIWEDLSENIPDFGTDFMRYNAQGGYNMMLSFHPTDSTVLFLGGTNLYRSDDLFTTSNNTSYIGGYKTGSVTSDWDVYPEHHPDQHILLFYERVSSNGDTAFIALQGNDGGIFTSENILTQTPSYTPKNTGYYTTQLYTQSINLNAATSTILAGYQDNGNFKTSGGIQSNEWKMIFNGDGSYSHILPSDTEVVASIQRGKVRKILLNSEGDVLGYQRIDPAGVGTDNVSFIHPYIVNLGNNSQLYYPVDDTLWRLSGLDTIAYSNVDLPRSEGYDWFSDEFEFSGRNITALAIAPNEEVLYVAGSNRFARMEQPTSASPEFYPSEGRNSDGVKLLNTGFVSDLAINPSRPEEVLLVQSNYGLRRSIVHTQDGGDTWNDVGGNLDDDFGDFEFGPSIRSAAILPMNDDTVYLVGTSIGLFGTRTFDGENTVWSRISPDEVGHSIVTEISYRLEDGYLLIGTHGEGMFAATVTQSQDLLSIAESPKFAGVVFVQGQSLLFEGFLGEDVTGGQMLDLQGREIQTLSREAILSGQVTLRSTSNKGVYLVRIQRKDGEYTSHKIFI